MVAAEPLREPRGFVVTLAHAGGFRDDFEPAVEERADFRRQRVRAGFERSGSIPRTAAYRMGA